MEFKLKTFQELSVDYLYTILQLRTEVFVVEQDCVYQDLDGRDREAFHLSGEHNGTVVAYARILKPDTLFKEPSIGRVVTSPKYRRQNLGKEIFAQAINEVSKMYPSQPIRIMAQSYLIPFYRQFGFRVASKEFLEDGIPHVEMLK